MFSFSPVDVFVDGFHRHDLPGSVGSGAKCGKSLGVGFGHQGLAAASFLCHASGDDDGARGEFDRAPIQPQQLLAPQSGKQADGNIRQRVPTTGLCLFVGEDFRFGILRGRARDTSSDFVLRLLILDGEVIELRHFHSVVDARVRR